LIAAKPAFIRDATDGSRESVPMQYFAIGLVSKHPSAHKHGKYDRGGKDQSAVYWHEVFHGLVSKIGH
jgi:hypothetical protein